MKTTNVFCPGLKMWRTRTQMPVVCMLYVLSPFKCKSLFIDTDYLFKGLLRLQCMILFCPGRRLQWGSVWKLIDATMKAMILSNLSYDHRNRPHQLGSFTLQIGSKSRRLPGRASWTSLKHQKRPEKNTRPSAQLRKRYEIANDIFIDT